MCSGPGGLCVPTVHESWHLHAHLAIGTLGTWRLLRPPQCSIGMWSVQHRNGETHYSHTLHCNTLPKCVCACYSRRLQCSTLTMFLCSILLCCIAPHAHHILCSSAVQSPCAYVALQHAHHICRHNAYCNALATVPSCISMRSPYPPSAAFQYITTAASHSTVLQCSIVI